MDGYGIKSRLKVGHMADWTLSQYRELCECIKSSDYTVMTLKDYVCEPVDRALILRHDVDRFPKNALKMASLEAELGFLSTYYIRMVPSAFSAAITKRIAELGHEIGYHYETLSKKKGDIGAAKNLFKKELAELQRISPIFTAAAHGSPLSRYDNKTIWQNIVCEENPPVAEAYFSIDYNQMAYYTDTGRSWNGKDANIRDRVTTDVQFPVVEDFSQLLALINTGNLPSICIQTHPERWSFSKATHIRSVLFDRLANRLKRLKSPKSER